MAAHPIGANKFSHSRSG